MPENQEPRKKKVIKLKVKSKVKTETVDNKTKDTTKPTEVKKAFVPKKPFDPKKTNEQKRSTTYNKPKQNVTRKSSNSKFVPPATTTTENKDSGKNQRKKGSHQDKSKNQNYKQGFKRSQEEMALNKMKKNIINKQKRGEAVIPDEIEIGEYIIVSDLAKKMSLKASELIKKLMDLGVMATINDTIDAETAQIAASEFNCKVTVRSLREEAEINEEEDKPEDLQSRPPIVTIMGHVDHGKTKLLDAIRNSHVADHESGGITQHIGAYKVKIKDGEITFLDTPGHAAFTAMRARGAEVTDIVIIVISAADGIMPQTVEAINHAKAANVPIIVAINKMDLPEANPERAKQQLAENGLMPEEWGGDTMCLPISALKKEGIDELLEAVLLQAELVELKANPKKHGVGFVIESKMDIGKGALATVVMKSGMINVGDVFVVGTAMGKVRAMFDDKGKNVKVAMPSDPVIIMGFSEVPEAGDKFYVVESDEFARNIVQKRKVLKKMEESQRIKKQQMENAMLKLTSPDLKVVKVIIKADVQGSVEAIKQSLLKLKNKEIKTSVIHSAVGVVSESDVMLASSGAGIDNVGVAILAFRVRVDSIAKAKAESEGIVIKRFSIIYELIDYVTNILENRLEPDVTETVTGQAEVKEVFKITGSGKIAGCVVKEGTIKKSEAIRLYRDDTQIWDGKIKNLKRFTDEVSEVQEGFECGISLLNFENIKKGDVLESFNKVSKDRKFVAMEEEIPSENDKETDDDTNTDTDDTKK